MSYRAERLRVGGAGNDDATTEQRADATEVGGGVWGVVQDAMVGPEAAERSRRRAERCARRAERVDRVRAFRNVAVDLLAVVACLIAIVLLSVVAYRIYDRQYLEGALVVMGVLAPWPT